MANCLCSNLVMFRRSTPWHWRSKNCNILISCFVMHNSTRNWLNQGSVTFSSPGPYPDPARFQLATTIPADQKKGLRQKIKHFTANLMGMTKNLGILQPIQWQWQKETFGGVVGKLQSQKKGRGPDEHKSTRARWNRLVVPDLAPRPSRPLD